MAPTAVKRCARVSESAGIRIAECRCSRQADPWQKAPSKRTVFRPPDTAYLELTPACNNRCVGCANAGFIVDVDGRSQRLRCRESLLSAECWKQILEGLGPSVTRLYLTGGEPTLHPEFQAIAAAIAEREIDFVLFTNGRWPEPEALLSWLAGWPTFHGFLISLHGACRASHDAFTGVHGSFDEAVANIERATQRGFAVSTSTVLTRQAIRELDEIATLSCQLGACAATFNRYLVFAANERPGGNGKALSLTVPSRRELCAAIQQIERLRQESPPLQGIDYGPCIPQCFASNSSQGCVAGINSLAVDPWGNAKPCTDTALLCGNLLEKTLQEVWWSAEMNEWRALVPPACADCIAFGQCHGGCRALAIACTTNRDPLMSKEPILADPGLETWNA